MYTLAIKGGGGGQVRNWENREKMKQKKRKEDQKNKVYKC